MKPELAQALLREYRVRLMALDIAQAQNASDVEIEYERERVGAVEARIMELLVLVNDAIHPQARMVEESHHVAG
jgi:hypothetical protein